MIRSIEGLRGVAALLVALFHAYVYSKWGGFPASSGVLQHAWLFVDLFFVISGYVMAAAYSDRLDTRRSAFGYMIRRFFRLYPLHIVTTATALLAVIGIQTAKLVLAHQGIRVGNEEPFGFEFFDLKLLGLDVLLLQGVGIMRKEIHNYPSWSISVEFWLYLMFALLMLAVRPRAARISRASLIVAHVAWRTSSSTGLRAPEPLRTLDTRGLPRGMLSFFQGVLLFYFYRWFGQRRSRQARAIAAARRCRDRSPQAHPAAPGGAARRHAGSCPGGGGGPCLYLVDRQHLLGTCAAGDPVRLCVAGAAPAARPGPHRAACSRPARCSGSACTAIPSTLRTSRC